MTILMEGANPSFLANVDFLCNSDFISLAFNNLLYEGFSHYTARGATEVGVSLHSDAHDPKVENHGSSGNGLYQVRVAPKSEAIQLCSGNDIPIGSP